MEDLNKKAEVMAKFSERYDAWVSSQEGQTSAYEYERSFDAFMQQMGQELLQASVGWEADSRKKKVCKVGMARCMFRRAMCCAIPLWGFA